MIELNVLIINKNMPSKRRNNGRSKNNKGHANVVRCGNCARVVPKDKAIKRFQMRNMLDGSSRRDVKENFAYKDVKFFHLPKLYIKQQYCVACAIHSRVVRARSSSGRAGAKGERFKRYTTKLRDNVRFEALTGSAAVPMISPDRMKFL